LEEKIMPGFGIIIFLMFVAICVIIWELIKEVKER